MDKEYSEAIVEVLGILYELEEKEFKKIPTEVIEFFEKNKSNTYKPDIDYTADEESLILKEKTKEILAGIYLDYLCQESDKEGFIKNIRENNAKYEEELRLKYDVNNIFKERNNKVKEDDKQGLTTMQKENIFYRIFKKIKKMIYKK